MTVLAMVIGLEDRYRGAELERQLRAMEVNVQWSPGVIGSYEGAPVASYADQNAARVLYGRELKLGEIGCALAHRDSYRTLLASDCEWALVFEDDARIVRPDALAELIRVFDAMPADAGASILMLYGRQMVADPRFHEPVGLSHIHELARTPMTATAYFINRAAAQHIVDTGLPLRNPADWPVSVEGTIAFAGAYPWPVVPDETGEVSSIGSRGGGRNAATKMFNRLASMTFLKWPFRRRFYRSFGEYRSWEVRRRAVQMAIGSRVPYRIPEDAAVLPSAGPFAVNVDRVLGGRRDGSFVKRIAAQHRRSGAGGGSAEAGRPTS